MQQIEPIKSHLDFVQLYLQREKDKEPRAHREGYQFETSF